MTDTPFQLIDKIGTAKIAKAVGLDQGAVRTAKCRNKLPRNWWPELSAAFPDLTLERLRKIEANAGR